ncbi:hypothetical protein ACTDI4_03590 [Mesorhizobium sp. PUT5]|uniref:hypothetical protein n=1 Tax=Mesorhizobium sp. PUT5 TaxID=3454629 RepID=UPI003FA41102
MSPSVAAAVTPSALPPGKPLATPASQTISKPISKLVAKLPAACLIVFGLDANGRPHASWFGDEDVALARKAAAMMGMVAVAATSEALRRLAAQLPAGRVFASGRAFVPFVKGGLYSELVAQLPAGAGAAAEGAEAGARAAKAAGVHATPATAPHKPAGRDRGAGAAPPAETAASAQGGPAESNSGSAAQTKPEPANPVGTTTAASPADPARQSGWAVITAGDLVLAKEEGEAEGWYEARVVELRGELFTLTWRDWPELGRIVRRAEHIARLHPAYVAASH